MSYMRKEIDNDTTPLGPVRHITLHWAASGYTYNPNPGSGFQHYHFVHDYDPKTNTSNVIQTRSTKVKGSHCWYRNGNNLGLSFLAMASDNYPVKDAQIESMARTIAELCGMFGLDIEGSITLPGMMLSADKKSLVPTGKTIVVPVVSDHALMAKHDGYYPERTDIGKYYPIVMKKAIEYRKKLVNKEIPNSLVGKIN